MSRAANKHWIRGGAIDIRWIQTLIPSKEKTLGAINYWINNKTSCYVIIIVVVLKEAGQRFARR